MRAFIAAALIGGMLIVGPPARAADAPLQLKPSPPIEAAVPAFPRIVAASDDKAAARINSALAKLDALTRQAMKECRADVDNADDFDFARTVTVTMRGPRYLSFSVGGGQDCGGAHPDSGSAAFIYDLTTGSPVNWQRLLPKSMVQGTSRDTDINGATIAFVTSKTLQSLWIKAEAANDPDPECKDAVSDPKLQLSLYPDAKAGGLAVQPGDFAHVIVACADTIVIPTATLRPLGVDAGLLDAIDAAHAGGFFDKNEP
ncbi:MAG TPA: hypothetical protein VHX19_01435 [Stellaceae bacterium]|jgi:hypothetical protein|nr:hypothetical protein [Stellaceae bacterium]